MSAAERVLVVDDEPESREALAELLRAWGFEVGEASNGSAALAAAERAPPDLVITDLVMPGVDGVELLRAMRAQRGDVPVVVITGRGGVEEAVRATREGALHFIQKPVDPVLLRATLRGAFESHRARQEVRELHRRASDARGGPALGRSPAMRALFALVDRVGPSKASVVITGPSGSGKELVARAVHEAGPRRDKPFVAINCAAIPATLVESELFGHERGAFSGADQRRPGCFELADGGTLFLDEVGELPLEAQAKFLRVLEEQQVRRLGGRAAVSFDVRVVAATNRDLRAQVAAGRFREDLYFRLNVLQLEVPPLAARPEDVAVLAVHFVRRFARESGREIAGLTPRAVRLLESHRWPGNVRELRNCLERAVLLCDAGLIDDVHLPRDLGAPPATDDRALAARLPLRELVRRHVEETLARHGGHRGRTAQALGISEKTLYNKLQRYAAGRDDPDGEDD